MQPGAVFETIVLENGRKIINVMCTEKSDIKFYDSKSCIKTRMRDVILQKGNCDINTLRINV